MGQRALAQPQIDMSRVHAYETSQRTVHWTNVTGAAVTVTSLAASDGAFSVALAAGYLPQTVLPGEGIDTVLAFDTTRPDATANIDLRADAAVIGRIRASGSTIKQIQPVSYSFDSVPKGATYTLPVRVRNSSPVMRTISSVTSDDGQVAVSGLVGTPSTVNSATRIQCAADISR